ncbi:MAG: hypothetical protein M3N13_06975 [Candidatus Eremiobacteraeota bacterium]|nr:hypothetical protein [Candidatus Eremiobacteraeota bacterium]
MQATRFLGSSLLATLWLAGCSAGAGSRASLPASGGASPQLAGMLRQLQPAAQAFGEPAGRATATLKIYLSNYNSNAVTTYFLNGKQTSPTITDGIASPQTVEVDRNGKIYVADLAYGVTTYLPDGTKTTPSIPSYGADGVAIDTAGNIYIANNFSGAITKYTKDGTQVAPTIGGFTYLNNVAVDKTGKIYAVDKNALTTYKPDGTPTTPTITMTGKYPVAVRVRHSKIYVAVAGANKIRTFALDGKPATPTIAIRSPHGLAVSTDGNIYATDATDNEMFTYNAQSGKQVAPTITGINGATGVGVH